MFGRLTRIIAAASLLFTVGLANAEMVNINKADAAALEQNLEGIGPVKAKAIVNYRRKNGSFKSIDDLANVDGIGEMLIKNNRRNMSLSRGATTASAKKSSSSSAKKSSSSSKSSTSSKKSSSDKKSSASKSSKKESSSAKKSSSKKTTSAKKSSSKKTSSKTSAKKSSAKKKTN